jgi:ferrochelatase
VPPFDAVLIIAFGGPQGPEDIHPFLDNVLRGRRVAPARVKEVAHHYALFGGVSPLTAHTERQAEGLRERLRGAGMPLRVYVGMRNWHPYLRDTLAAMSRDGVRRAIGFIAAAHRSYSSCTQYKEDVTEARAAVRAMGLADVEVTYVADWHTHPDFIAANAEHVRAARACLPHALRDRARLVFTAHSIPVSMAERYPYRAQFEETARLIDEEVRLKPDTTNTVTGVASGLSRTYDTVYQSRSGQPEDPWLGPDVCDYLREQRGQGLEAALLCPVGFLCDHVEVLYDLDVEAAEVAREIGLPMVRARAVNDHPRFLDMMCDVVLDTYARYDHSTPLQIVAG